MTRKLELRKDKKLRMLKLYRIKRIAKHKRLRRKKIKISNNSMLQSKNSLMIYKKRYKKTSAST